MLTSVVTVPEYTSSVSFGRLLRKTAIMVWFVFDEWVNLLSRQVPGMGDYDEWR